MINTLRAIHLTQRFNPTFPLGLILNDHYLVNRSIRNFIKEEAQSFSGDVLDVGCGQKPYRHFFKCSTYVGLDLEKSKKNGLNGSKADYFYDGLIMPFTDEQFDQIISTEVLEHVRDPSVFIGEICRILKPGGELMLTTPFVWHEHGAPFDFQRFTSYGIDNLMKQKGFEKIGGKKLLDGPEIIPILFVLYLIDINSNLVRKFNNSRFLSIFLFVLMRPVILLLNILTLALTLFPRDKNLYFNNGVRFRKV